MRWIAVLFVLFGLVLPLHAQEAAAPADPVLVRQNVVPATGAVVGQRVALYVDVMFHDTMPRPPRVGIADVPGLQLFRFETQGVTLRETVAGTTYVGQRFEFALYARRGGRFDVPPASVTLLDREGAVTASVQGESVRLDVAVPPGVDVSQPVVATRQLVLTEEWSPDSAGPLKAGDAIVRTVTRSAEDVPGLAMRDLVFAAPDGVRAYVDPPDIADRSNRSVVTGHRVDRITYVFEHGGRFELPAVAQPWWNLGSHRLEMGRAAAATIQVADVPASPAAGPTARWQRASLIRAAALLAGLIVLGLGVMWLLQRWQAYRAEPERAAFRALARACAGTDPAEIYRKFRDWSAQLPARERAIAEQGAADLKARLFGAHADPWREQDSQRLLAQLTPLRAGPSQRAEPPALPPLNPVFRPMPGRWDPTRRNA